MSHIDDPKATDRVRARLQALSVLAARVAAEQADRISTIAVQYVRTLRRDGILFFVGNGGSAADAQHVATEYVVRYSGNRRPFAAIALTTDTSLLTACGNDLGFDDIFARQVDALVTPKDLLILHSTSGVSPNILRAVATARAKGVTTVGLLGKGGGDTVGLVDHALVVPSDETSHIQEMHLAVEHIICEIVEVEMLHR